MTKRTRNTPASTVSARKRVRVSHDALLQNMDIETRAETRSTSARSRRRDFDRSKERCTGSASASASDRRKSTGQKTLTQIEFVDNPSPSLGNALQTVNGGLSESKRMRRSRRSGRSVLRKRDSTLTQMDFFTGGDETLEADLLELQPLQMEFEAGSLAECADVAAGSIPQVDGVREASMSTAVLKQQQKQSQRQETRLSRAARKSEVEENRLSKRRKVDQPRPLLEIQDSTEFVDATETQVDTFFNHHALAPSTPRPSRTSIPSSQSPESLPPITRRTRSATRQSARKPLADISTNLPVSSGKALLVNAVNTADSYTAPSKKWISKLKARSKPLSPPGRRVEDSQQDIFPLRVTSSPRPIPSPKKESAKVGTHVLPRMSKDSSVVSITIPETDGLAPSQNNNVLNARDVNYHASQTNSQRQMLPPQLDRQIGDQVNSVPIDTIDAVEDLDADMIQFPGDVVDMDPETVRGVPDDVSDFGSPVKNDTQFVQSLFQRISSPLPSSSSNILPAIPKRNPTTTEASTSKISSDASHVTVPTQILPTPRLVRTSPQQPLPRLPTDMSFINLPSADRSSEQVQTTHIPLNDTAIQHSTSSDPLLPPPPLPRPTQTQGSVYPASIPHPSQVSTQIPTQGYFPHAFESHTQHAIASAAAAPEQLIIVNSSSVPVRLDQAARETQESVLGVHLVDGSDEFDDDLNPASMRPYRSNTKRKLDAADFEHDLKDIVDADVEDVTQTPTQKSRIKNLSATEMVVMSSSSQASILVTNATTKSQRDAKLEIVYLASSSPPPRTIIAKTVPPECQLGVEASQRQARNSRHASQPEQVIKLGRGRKSMPAIGRPRSPSPSHFRARQSRPQPLRRGKDPVQFDFSSTQERSSDEEEQTTPRPSHSTNPAALTERSHNPAVNLPLSSPPATPSPRRQLQRKHDALPGFDNETQSDLTQRGHVTAAYIHRQREKGILPDWFIPRPFKIRNFDDEEVDEEEKRG